MVDIGRLRAMLDRLGDELDNLQRLAAMSDDDLLADPERMPGAKYRLQIAVEAAIDAAEHVIASSGWTAPETFADAFTILGEKDVLSNDLAESLEDAARFRNLLVHGYADIDDVRVREILRTRLSDLASFRQQLARFATTGVD